MKRELKERTILDRFAGDFVDIIEKHVKYIIVLDENEIIRIKAIILRLRLS